MRTQELFFFRLSVGPNDARHQGCCGPEGGYVSDETQSRAGVRCCPKERLAQAMEANAHGDFFFFCKIPLHSSGGCSIRECDGPEEDAPLPEEDMVELLGHVGGNEIDDEEEEEVAGFSTISCEQSRCIRRSKFAALRWICGEHPPTCEPVALIFVLLRV